MPIYKFNDRNIDKLNSMLAEDETFSSLQDLLDKNIIIEVPADKPMTKTLETLTCNDSLRDSEGNIVELVATTEGMAAYMHGDFVRWRQKKALKEDGYTIVQPESETKCSTSKKNCQASCCCGGGGGGPAMEMKSESERWKPASGQRYYYVDFDACKEDEYWDNDSIDRLRYDAGNVWKTEEAALEAAEKTKALWRSLRK